MRFVSRFDSEHIIFLAPPSVTHATRYGSVQVDTSRYNYFLNEAQRLRGRVYLEDGAIERRQLSLDGRLVHPHDANSWQLLMMNDEGRVAGCLRYVPHAHHISFFNLGVARSALAYSPAWGYRLRRAVDAERSNARARGMSYAEVGGLALSQELRHRGSALKVLLNVYALMNFLGGALAVATATVRHQSSSILRRMGGETLVSDGVEVPSYYDPQYECEMEILRFDSDQPPARYKERINQYLYSLLNEAVICARTPVSEPAYSVVGERSLVQA